MAKIRKDPSFICIRENFSFNKHFMPGDPFPEEWLTVGYKPNKHFAPAKIAADELERVKLELTMQGHGDDPRSTVELKKALAKYMEIDGEWPRKKIWLELVRLENADDKTAAKGKRA